MSNTISYRLQNENLCRFTYARGSNVEQSGQRDKQQQSIVNRRIRQLSDGHDAKSVTDPMYSYDHYVSRHAYGVHDQILGRLFELKISIRYIFNTTKVYIT